jgi:methyl-accepting chemotaxis protein
MAVRAARKGLKNKMNWFLNQRTMTKLMLGFGFFAVLLGVVGYLGLSGLSKVNGMLDRTYTKEMAGVAAIEDIEVSLLEVARVSRQVIIDTDAAAVQADEAEYRSVTDRLSEKLAAADPLFYTPEGQVKLGEVKTRVSEYLSDIKELFRLRMQNKDAEAAEQLKNARTAANAVADSVERTAAFKKLRAAEFFKESQQTYVSTRNMVIALVLAAVFISIVVGFFIAQTITKPLGAMVVVLGRLAQRDLTARMSDSKGDFRSLEESLNTAASNLEQALEEVRDSSDQVALTSEQLSSASQSISSGAQEQAASLEETSATLEEITSTVRQNADSARHANQLAAGAREAAEKGGSVMISAVAAMGEINTASNRIADIITTIDEIAFQTNLLALNAAVEAARAGEQGRGFAVVASEVRSLAQRSASAAKEIKGLIQDSVRKVENGSGLVNASGQTLNEIVASVKRVTDIVGEIAAASQEQATGVEQVAKAMSQMDEVTQANSAQTEEMSSTAEELSATAASLQELVAQFKLAGAAVRGGAASARQKAQPKKAVVSTPKRPKPGKQTSSGLAALAVHTGPSNQDFEEF